MRAFISIAVVLVAGLLSAAPCDRAVFQKSAPVCLYGTLRDLSAEYDQPGSHSPHPHRIDIKIQTINASGQEVASYPDLIFLDMDTYDQAYSLARGGFYVRISAYRCLGCQWQWCPVYLVESIRAAEAP